MKKEPSLFELIKRLLRFKTTNKISCDKENITVSFDKNKKAKIKIVEKN